MVLECFGARRGLRSCVLGFAAMVAALAISSDAADARHHHRVHIHSVHLGSRSHHHVGGYSPPTASIVVDGNSGEVLQASNPDAMRHPASLTKIMTLYLLFERLDAGKIRLDTPLKVSEHASEQSPTKLGLKPGQTISVEDAIKGVVTRSANDAAVVIAENLGGDEASFAKLMTQKAHALGMNHTTYVNASGLPDDDQITTARDLALLGRAIQERFPRYYKYFSTPSFVYHGETIRNHDHLLGSMDGVDGIKTGFTRDSGFNLVTSVHRDGRYVIGVVLGGTSSSERDAHMRELINSHIRMASLKRTAPTIAEKTEPKGEMQSAASTKASLASRADPTSTATVRQSVVVGSSDPIKPLSVKTITYRTVPVQSASLSPMPALVAVPAPVPLPVPPQQTAHAATPTLPLEAPRTVVASADSESEAPPEPATPEPLQADSVEPAPAKAAAAQIEAVKLEEPKAAPAIPQVHPHSGWMIQIGAFDGEDEAKQHLSDAQVKVHKALAAADPFTERVQKGDKSLYRARFAGFDKQTAEAACRQLKRSDFQCMTVKD